MRLRVTATLLTVVAMLAACTPTRQHPASPSATTPGPHPSLPAAASEIWDRASGWVALPAPAARAPHEAWRLSIHTNPTGTYQVRDGVVVVSSADASGRQVVRRIDPRTGAPMWTTRTTVTGPPQLDLVDPDVVAVDDAHDNLTTQVALLSAHTGRILWSGKVPYTGHIQRAGRLVLLCSNQQTIAISLDTAKPVWRAAHTVFVLDGIPVIEEPDSFGVLDPTTGRPRWTRPRPTEATIDAAGGTVFQSVRPAAGHSGRDDTVTAYDARTGRPRWNSVVPDLGDAKVMGIDDRTVLFYPDVDSPGWGSAVRLDTGHLVWHRAMSGPGDPPIQVVRIGSRTVVVAADPDTSEVVCYAATDGAPLTLGPPLRSYRSIYAAATLYLLTPEGDLAAADLPSTQPDWKLTPQQDLLLDGPVAGGLITEIPGDGDTVTLVGYLD